MHLATEARDDGGWGFFGCEGREPSLEDNPFEAGLFYCRHIRQGGRARGGRLGDDADRASAMVRDDGGWAEHCHRDVSGDQIVDGLARAPIRDVIELDSRGLGEPLSEEILV